MKQLTIGDKMAYSLFIPVLQSDEKFRKINNPGIKNPGLLK